jgi:anti-sigma regulatory factor (Ser/Thr protein kinase)
MTAAASADKHGPIDHTPGRTGQNGSLRLTAGRSPLMRSRLSSDGRSNGLDVLERRLVSDASAPRLAREMIGQMALTAEIDQRGRLLASEVVTNAVCHGGSGPILAHMARHSEGLDVTVTDSGPGFTYTPAAAANQAIGGRGLFLVDQLADAWSTGGPGDPSVHFRLDAPQMHRVDIVASGIALSIGVTGYESADAAGPDANWLRGEFELELRSGPADGFKASMAVAWTTCDLLSFQESLRTLLGDSNGTAELITADDQVQLAIALKDGVGTVSGRAAQASFDRVAISSRELQPALGALEVVLHAYPRRP